MEFAPARSIRSANFRSADLETMRIFGNRWRTITVITRLSLSLGSAAVRPRARSRPAFWNGAFLLIANPPLQTRDAGRMLLWNPPISCRHTLLCESRSVHQKQNSHQNIAIFGEPFAPDSFWTHTRPSAPVAPSAGNDVSFRTRPIIHAQDNAVTGLRLVNGTYT